jgi:uncharacterized protein involved in exopolysaccharide biosynthesis
MSASSAKKGEPIDSQPWVEAPGMSVASAAVMRGAQGVVLARRYWKLFALLMALGVMTFEGLALAQRRYVATASFVAQSSTARSLGQLGSVAAQLGMVGLSEEPETSVHFYSMLIESRPILEALAATAFPVSEAAGDSQAVLLELISIAGDEETKRLQTAVEGLRALISVTASIQTNVVTVRVAAPEKLLAEGMAGRLLELLNEFNLRRRQNQAGNERQFIERRLASARDSLDAAERALVEFMERNRQRSSSPQLQFEEGRLQRRIALRQNVYTSLAEAYERARIQEVRNIPVITGIEDPEGSAVLRWRVFMSAILGLLTGCIVAAVWVFTLEGIGSVKLAVRA